MKYMGSKDKISIEIKSIIDLNRTSLKQAYVEPFVGGANMIDKIKGKRIAGDNNKYLIALWRGLQANLERPEEITKGMYDNAKKDFKNGSNNYYNNFLIGYIGFLASFNGKFFNGYANKRKNGRNDIDEGVRNINTQIKLLQDVSFYHSDYQKLLFPDNSIIYCDIPYKNTTEYKTDIFNYPEFYDYAERKSKEGHKVFISEYWMPADRFTKIWQKQVNCGMVAGSPKNKIESLFIPKNQKIKQYATLF